MTAASSFGHYAGFILSSYALVIVVVAALIAAIAMDYRRQREKLRNLESGGIARRSAPQEP